MTTNTDYAALCSKLRAENERLANRDALYRLPDCTVQLSAEGPIPMCRLLRERAERAERDAARLDWLDSQRDDWTYKDRNAWNLIGAKHLSVREAIDYLSPQADDAALAAQSAGESAKGKT